MTVFIIIWFILLLSLIPVLYLCKKYKNPYRLYMVFGKKGSGKTTYMCKLAIKAHKRGQTVYSTIPLPYAIQFDVQELGKKAPPPGSLVLIDEVGMIWDNRNFKAFRTDVRDYFKLQRHYKNTVYLFSQTFDIDIKLRNLTDAMFLVTAPLPFISIVRRIKRSIVLVQPNQESEGRIADSLEFVPIWLSLFGSKSLQFTYIPHWAKFFDSHETPDLPLFSGVIDTDWSLRSDEIIALSRFPKPFIRFFDYSFFIIKIKLQKILRSRFRSR